MQLALHNVLTCYNSVGGERRQILMFYIERGRLRFNLTSGLRLGRFSTRLPFQFLLLGAVRMFADATKSVHSFSSSYSLYIFWYAEDKAHIPQAHQVAIG